MMRMLAKLAVIVLLSTCIPGLIHAQSTDDDGRQLPPPTRTPPPPTANGSSSGIVTADGFVAVATGPWHPLPNPPFYPDTALLLTNGTVMAQDYGTPNWWLLTPDAYGSYFNGTWSQLPPMPNSYAPYDYCSAVLADGRVVVIGGEYTYDSSGNATATETNMGAIYDPVANSWAVLNPPPGWTHVGDASCTVMSNGQLMLADNFTRTLGEVALLDPASLTWTLLTPAGKVDGLSEENWTLLPDGSILTVDTRAVPGAERFLPPWLSGLANGEWISAGSTPSAVALRRGDEMGPQVLRPDGTLFAAGATGNNAVYTPPTSLLDTGTWSAAPAFPVSPVAGEGQLDVCDGSGIVLTNGNVLVGASPGCYNIDDYFFEFDGKDLDPVDRPSFGPYISSFWLRPLMLPTGEVMVTYDNNDVELYRSHGQPRHEWRPQITRSPFFVSPGQTYKIEGTRFNGLTEDENYGDDESDASNYPLVRITNLFTRHVFYARTHDHSTMAVATGNQPVFTYFDTPANLEGGISELVVVANGIESDPIFIIVPPGQGGFF